MLKRYKSIITTLLISITIVFGLIVGFGNISSSMDEQDLVRLEETIVRAAVSCYSIEGFYPADVEYLEKYYGVIIDDEKYNIFYEVIGSNIIPTINVYRKG